MDMTKPQYPSMEISMDIHIHGKPETNTSKIFGEIYQPEWTIGQWVMGHGSDGSIGQWVMLGSDVLHY